MSLDPVDIIRILRLFNARADKLEHSGFLASYRAGNNGYSWTWIRGEGTTVQRHLPSEEEIEAFVLTFRLFVQPRDDISFSRMAAFYTTLPVTSALRDRVVLVSKGVTQYLNDPSGIILDGIEVTRRHIFEIVMYGGMAHVNKDKRDLYERWHSHEIQFPLVEEAFSTIIATVTQAVFTVRDINARALAELAP